MKEVVGEIREEIEEEAIEEILAKKNHEGNLFVKNYFPLADFVNLEIVMMSYFHWNLVRHFLVYHISITLTVPTACQ